MRILVIEDDKKIALAIKKGLEQESYSVDVVFDTKDDKLGLALLINYDLIILDRMLPGISDGLNICKKLRNEGKKMPILILTAKDKINERVEGLDAGADDYLIKPFAFEELLARVKALLRRPNQALNQVLKVGDLSLDTQTFKVMRKNIEIKLSSTEFKLLEYLMRNKGRILTKDNIMEHVWDYDAEILPNTVEVFIGYLRNKIDKPFSNSGHVQTIRGFGYKIE